VTQTAGRQALKPFLGKTLKGPEKEETEFHKWIAVLARATNTHIDQMLVAAYDHRLQPLGYQNSISAIKDILADRRPNDAFPSAREISDRIYNHQDDKFITAEVADLILKAVSKKGSYWHQDIKPHNTLKEAMIAELGDLGEMAVQNVGGWFKCVEICNKEGVEKFRWHLKETTAYCLEKARRGTLGKKPSLPFVAYIQIQGKKEETIVLPGKKF